MLLLGDPARSICMAPLSALRRSVGACRIEVMEPIVYVLPTFLLACLVLAVLPGPATALFLHRTLRDGRRAGLAAVAGNEIGVFAWALAGGAGLSVLLAANRVLFDALHVV